MALWNRSAFPRAHAQSEKKQADCVSRASALALASSSQPYFSAYAHARAKVGGEGKEKYVWAPADPGFCDSVVCAEYLPRVHNDY